ncbi:peptidase U32 family protein [Chengkuizengella axinellae]|uniref:Peptidase U32 family protein n=1 Tax=Chengkuizengella axinellae TaxID=3064388 RepID=A0ABT9ITZ3_9BACL|nr:peptidase U32 family protein [Chengkuizengella sp. 2205SS18-9]MDP5272811.1 peptidase U32 family protein [Chengkuizengella sp. 2205SS18-9]
MRQKPELLVTAGSIEELERLIQAGADAVNIGHNEYGVRMPGNFSIEEIKEAVRIAHGQDVKVYVSLNNIFNNAQLESLPSYLKELHDCKVDAITFGDPAVVSILNQVNIKMNLHWNTEMTSTNYVTANYWGTKGATRMILARELNLEEIQDVSEKLNLESQIQIHGITNIYHSKRELVKSYMGHIRKEDIENFDQNRNLYLVEHERQDLKLPIYEDENGTHIMSADDICTIDVLDEVLAEPIDSVKIEGLLKSIEYNETVVRCYREAIDSYFKNPESYEFNPEWLEQIKQVQDPDRELSYGFFFKEQVY